MLKLIQKQSRSGLVRIVRMSSTFNQSEVDKFKQMSSDWWNPAGVCKPLHSMNRLRVPLIRDGLKDTGLITKEASKSDKPLNGIRFVYTGCLIKGHSFLETL